MNVLCRAGKLEIMKSNNLPSRLISKRTTHWYDNHNWKKGVANPELLSKTSTWITENAQQFQCSSQKPYYKSLSQSKTAKIWFDWITHTSSKRSGVQMMIINIELLIHYRNGETKLLQTSMLILKRIISIQS